MPLPPRRTMPVSVAIRETHEMFEKLCPRGVIARVHTSFPAVTDTGARCRIGARERFEILRCAFRPKNGVSYPAVRVKFRREQTCEGRPVERGQPGWGWETRKFWIPMTLLRERAARE